MAEYKGEDMKIPEPEQQLAGYRNAITDRLVASQNTQRFINEEISAIMPAKYGEAGFDRSVLMDHSTSDNEKAAELGKLATIRDAAMSQAYEKLVEMGVVPYTGKLDQEFLKSLKLYNQGKLEGKDLDAFEAAKASKDRDIGWNEGQIKAAFRTNGGNLAAAVDEQIQTASRFGVQPKITKLQEFVNDNYGALANYTKLTPNELPQAELRKSQQEASRRLEDILRNTQN